MRCGPNFNRRRGRAAVAVEDLADGVSWDNVMNKFNRPANLCKQDSSTSSGQIPSECGCGVDRP